MAFFDELSKKLSGVSRVAVRKAKEVTDIGSLKLQIADENRKLSKIYENLGREYYDKFQDDAAEELAELVSQIKDSNDKIAGLQDEISRVEAESAARAEEERVRREAEAQAKKESVAEAEMRVVDEDEEEEAKKNGEMTESEEETTGETEAGETEDAAEDEEAYETEVEAVEADDEAAEETYADETERVGDALPETALVAAPAPDGEKSTRAHRKPQQYRREEDHKRIRAPHGGERVTPDGARNDERIGDVVKLLENVPGEHRQREEKKRAENAPPRQIAVHVTRSSRNACRARRG